MSANLASELLLNTEASQRAESNAEAPCADAGARHALPVPTVSAVCTAQAHAAAQSTTATQKRSLALRVITRLATPLRNKAFRYPRPSTTMRQRPKKPLVQKVRGNSPSLRDKTRTSDCNNGFEYSEIRFESPSVKTPNLKNNFPDLTTPAHPYSTTTPSPRLHYFPRNTSKVVCQAHKKTVPHGHGLRILGRYRPFYGNAPGAR
jgi:hypothetical protein